MIYGTKMIYKYSEEIPKVNEKGETLIDDNGDFVTESVEKQINLSFNLMTYLIYKNIVGTDLMKDFVNFGKKYIKKTDTTDIDKIDTENISAEDIDKMSAIWDNETIKFLIQVTAAMIATTEYPKQRPFEDIIANLPTEVFFDGEFIKEIVQLISFNIKKKIQYK